jgi:hypothetical protein
VPVCGVGRFRGRRARGLVCSVAACRGDVFGFPLMESLHVIARRRPPARPQRPESRLQSGRGGGGSVSFRGWRRGQHARARPRVSAEPLRRSLSAPAALACSPAAGRNDHSNYPALLARVGASMLGSEHGDFRFVPEFLPSLSQE